jgi:hypothetical protein
MSVQPSKGYLILRNLNQQAGREMLYMFHNLELAHQYLGVNVVGERYDVLSRTIGNGLQRLHLHDRYTFREMDVWVETVNIMDGCLMDNFGGADGINGRVEDFWTPVDREMFQIRFAG